MLLQHGALPPLMVLQIAAVMTDALGYAHKHGGAPQGPDARQRAGLDDGLLKLIDFGIADAAQPPEP